MRARYLESWPALTFHFGITPENFTDYSVAEFNRYLHALREMNRR